MPRPQSPTSPPGSTSQAPIRRPLEPSTRSSSAGTSRSTLTHSTAGTRWQDRRQGVAGSVAAVARAPDGLDRSTSAPRRDDLGGEGPGRRRHGGGAGLRRRRSGQDGGLPGPVRRVHLGLAGDPDERLPGRGANTFGWAELNARGLDKALPFYQRGVRLDAPSRRTARTLPYTEFQIDGERIAGAMEMNPMVPAEVPSYWMATSASRTSIAPTARPRRGRPGDAAAGSTSRGGILDPQPSTGCVASSSGVQLIFNEVLNSSAPPCHQADVRDPGRIGLWDGGPSRNWLVRVR